MVDVDPVTLFVQISKHIEFMMKIYLDFTTYMEGFSCLFNLNL